MTDIKGDTPVLDLAVIGAGISGINAAYRFQAAFPNRSYEVFEARNEIGGTVSDNTGLGNPLRRLIRLVCAIFPKLRHWIHPTKILPP